MNAETTPWEGGVEPGEMGAQNPGTDDQPEADFEVKEEETIGLDSMEPEVVGVPRNEPEEIADDPTDAEPAIQGSIQCQEPIGVYDGMAEKQPEMDKSVWGTSLAPQQLISIPKQNGGCHCVIV